jgi:hypothetical protein
MISKHIKEYCKDDLSKIENYDKAVDDTEHLWVCHHRLELTLDGEFAHSKKELIRMNIYYHRPYFELIFMKDADHRRLHATNRIISEETRKKLSKINKGKASTFKGKKHTEEFKRKISKARTGMKFSKEHCKHISESKQGQNKGHEKWYFGKPRSIFGEKYWEHFKLHMIDDKQKYDKERRFFLKYGKCRCEK